MAFMLLDEYTNLLGVCAACGSSRRVDEQVVDLGFDTDVGTDEDGQPAFRPSAAQMCSTCMREIATMLGWQTDQITAQINEMRHIIGTQRAELRSLREVKKAVEAIRV